MNPHQPVNLIALWATSSLAWLVGGSKSLAVDHQRESAVTVGIDGSPVLGIEPSERVRGPHHISEGGYMNTVPIHLDERIVIKRLIDALVTFGMRAVYDSNRRGLVVTVAEPSIVKKRGQEAMKV